MKTIFVSLGCDKNTVDTQKMAGTLADSRGKYTFTEDENEAEIAIVNTCAFINSAKQESIESILELAELKEKANLKYLVVTGCMAQRYKDEITRSIPEVDAVIGLTAEVSLVSVLDKLCAGDKVEEAVLDDPDLLPEDDRRQALTIGTVSGYLKIAEGCDKYCTYCVIPSLRGKYRSVPMEQILKDAQELINGGVSELILVAQETTLYGVDIYGKKMLPELLRRLCLLSGTKWIRVLYCYPEEITPELIEVMKEEKKVLPYLDMPIQHASDTVLRRMGRRTNRRELVDKIRYIREQIPEICLRTTLITGFPGETEEEHRELLEFVEEMKFDRLGVFTYSREEGTPAAVMKPQIHHATKKRRQKELMLAQQQVAFEKAASMKGRILEVVIEGRISGENVYVGRTYMDIPGVDSNIYIETERDLLTGEFLMVEVTGSVEYDLTGKPAEAME